MALMTGPYGQPLGQGANPNGGPFSGRPFQFGGQGPNGQLYAGIGGRMNYPGGPPNASGGFTPGTPGGGGYQGPSGPAGPSGTNFAGLAAQRNNMVPNYSTPPTAPPPVGQYTTSVHPAPIFSANQTQQAVNQAMANAQQLADPRWQQKQFMTPGVSQDQGKAAAALPGMANALFQGQQQAAQIPLMDAFANQNQLLSGQIGQQQEANGLANSLAQFNENNIYQQQQLMNPLLQLMGQYF